MRLQHFETLQPICPVCRTDSEQHRLKIATASEQKNEVIFEGILHCSNAACQREYPIIDGIPIIVCDIRSYISDNILPILSRSDLTATTESILGDCCSQGSLYEVTRQHLSSYTTSHYGHLAPKQNDSQEKQPNDQLKSLYQILQTGLNLVAQQPTGPVLDIGCSVGGTTFQLAADTEQLTLGIDLNFAMLRVASRVLHKGVVRYPQKQVGLVYERQEFEIDFPQSDRVDFWCADAMAIPLPDQSIDMTVGLNVLDCVNSPLALLQSIEKILRPGGKAILASPYDWSNAATPVENWLGGHSQRTSDQGSSESILRMLLTPTEDTTSLNKLRLISEAEHLPWHVYMNRRSFVQYDVHLVVAEAVGAQ